MPSLPTTTPQKTLPIRSFVAYLSDGRTMQVRVGSGDGFIRQQIIQSGDQTIYTYECFIVNGIVKWSGWRSFPKFGGGEMSTEETPKTPDEENEDEEEREKESE